MRLNFFDRTKNKTAGEISLEKGKTYLWSKQYEKALEIFEQINDLDLEPNIIIQKIKCYIALDDEKRLSEMLNEVIKYDEIKDVCYKKMGMYYYDKKNDPKAYECFKSISEANIEYTFLFKLGNICLNAKRYEEALSYYLRAYKFDKRNTTAFLDYKLGLCYEKLNDYEQALKYYKSSLKDSNNNYAYLKIGKIEQRLYEKENNLDHLISAKYYLIKGSNIYPDDIYIKYELLKVYLSLGNTTEAFNCAMEILEQKEDRYTLVQLIRIYYLQSKYDLAIDLCKKLLSQGDDKYIRLNLTKCYIEKRMYIEALDEVNKLLVLDEKDSYGLTEKAKIYLHLGKLEEAKKILYQIPDNINMNLMCEKLNLLSCVGEFVFAHEKLSKMLDENPNDGRLNITMSNILENNGYLYLSIDYNLRAIKCREMSSYVQHLATLYYNVGDYEYAEKNYLEYMSMEDNYTSGAIGLINVYMAQKKYEQAYNLAYQLLNTYKHDQALAVMAEIELLMGHRNIAENYLNEIIEGNSNREDSGYVKRLKSLIYK